ncbi:glycine oxidase [Bradyrhizobium sp. GM2.2]|jgi:glycine oxidase|uniref:FAD-dependent oxidoreductase n=1 Tax=unclassified Bradyrhizobium TaxID=2631580 RepID=UPI001FF71507|nr:MULTISPECIES: FAD-dependent oxidoreductase [unclassified Bradyrhizobium]MCK1271112.1 FAD-dependent oxidoreductase [Bradyrhizobium sp. 84]MCK1309165.1 FAD-dependent oxidoreductase [Bradyrhizobium sp. 45]MCK1316053.1 FAD-dependent oxidoreductase [Bradyrhizobium sp. 23]MCK1320965.1 FAD-dependent oxidoreductase [Bradyrhizobium sp. 156]MCK1333612.1 FAD-dependent oxidoreductase [Bradyrhizobium sp. CW9]
MLQTTKRPDSPVSIIGAGIAGAWQALLFAQAGHAVTLHERGDADMTDATSHWAGGMLAPYCEAEVSEPIISRLGLRSLDIWRRELPDTPFNGSLVVAHPRERSDFERFARMTEGHRRLDAAGLAELEPSLEGRFRDALFFPTEGHVEPRRVLPKLHERIRAAGGTIKFESDVAAAELAKLDPEGIVIDCRGLAARDEQPGLRGVKGEMILIETSEVQLARPVRLIHPRWPLYVIPREDNLFMLGATSIEAEDTGVSVRSALELLGAAYAVHPAFGEARIVEFGSGLRPAFPDNLPRIGIRGNTISVNGLYRHGFLIAPALAELTLGFVERGQIDNEVMQCA